MDNFLTIIGPISFIISIATIIAIFSWRRSLERWHQAPIGGIIIEEEILRTIRNFRVACLKDDPDYRTFICEIGTIVGIRCSLQMQYERPKLTPEQEKAIENMVMAKRKSLGIEE